MKKNKDLLQKAKNYAFLLLKFRLRSEKELYQRLKRKKFDQGIIKETLAFLKDREFINDKQFAKEWIEYSLKKPIGFSRIRQELLFKGVKREVIDGQIKKSRDSYSEEDIIDKITEQRLGKLKNITPVKLKRRLYAYLLRRGFSPELVIDTINKKCKADF